MKKRRSHVFLIALIALVFFALSSTDAKSQITYKTYLPLIQNHKQIGVNPANRAESLIFYQTNYRIENPPSIDWRGSHAGCDPGTTNPAFQKAVLQRINYFRAMAGVPADIIFSDESNLKAQAAALLMSVNGASSHNPPTTWTCYSSLAHEGASSSNLFFRAYGWNAITNYMKDPGDGNYFVGHRRWILYPQTRIMGTGDIPPTSGYEPSNALLVFDEHKGDPRPLTRDGFVAWPPPGYIPYPVVFARWSFSFPDADFSAASVSMRQAGKPVSINQSPIVTGFGENTLVWQISGMACTQNWPRPSQDTRYTIHINNVIIGGRPQNFSYEVIVFDPTP